MRAWSQNLWSGSPRLVGGLCWSGEPLDQLSLEACGENQSLAAGICWIVIPGCGLQHVRAGPSPGLDTLKGPLDGRREVSPRGTSQGGGEMRGLPSPLEAPEVPYIAAAGLYRLPHQTAHSSGDHRTPGGISQSHCQRRPVYYLPQDREQSRQSSADKMR